MHILLSLAAAMFAGLLFTRPAKKIGLPNVTAYLVAGLVVGPYCLGAIPKNSTEILGTVTTAALGFIAFSIGSEFKISDLKHVGTRITVITLFEALCAVFLVDTALIIARFPLPLSLMLGAIAAATAPAATLMVVRQYKAKGPVTSTLLPVVAMDDAVCLIAFAVSSSLSFALASGEALTFRAAVLEPLFEIAMSLAAGFVIGIAATYFIKFFHSRANFLCITAAAILLGVGIAEQFNLSSLLLCMMIGATIANMCNKADRVFEVTDGWTPPLFMLFFVISGAQLDIAAIPSLGLIGVIYIFVRVIGKWAGAAIGAKLTHSEPTVCKYLGVTLLPQAGVAIGMAQLSLTRLPQYGTQIQAVILCATLIYELVGPILTKRALISAGEIEKNAK